MRPAKLSLERHAELVRYAALGNPHRVCADLVALGERTLQRYLSRGREADELAMARISELRPRRQAALWRMSDLPVAPPADAPASADVAIGPGGERAWTPVGLARGRSDGSQQRAYLTFVDEAEQPFWRLWLDIKRADASWEAVTLGRIAEAGKPHKVTTTRTTEKYDPEGKLLEKSTVTTERDERAWQANAHLLQSRLPHLYGRFRPGQGVVFPEDIDADPDTPVMPSGLEDEKAAAERALDELDERRRLRDLEPTGT